MMIDYIPKEKQNLLSKLIPLCKRKEALLNILIHRNWYHQANLDIWSQTVAIPLLDLTDITKKLDLYSFKA